MTQSPHRGTYLQPGSLLDGNTGSTLSGNQQLALGPAIYGALAAGVIGKGIPTGGFFGISSGEYAFQHAQISLGMQAVGVLVIIIGTAVFELILLAIIDRLVGLRVAPEQERQGFDETYWSHAVDHHEADHGSLHTGHGIDVEGDPVPART